MIIELFGPPGVGKTTFAAALVPSLGERGCKINPVLSFRPAELGDGRRRTGSAARRVFRPMVETLAAVCQRGNTSETVNTPAGLLRLLPPANRLWSIRLHQYLVRLYQSWEGAAANPTISLFDQAFVQAVCSLVLLGRQPKPGLVAAALEAVPKPDLLIRLDAAARVLEARLTERHSHQGRLERLLELDLATNLRAIDVVRQLDGMLRARGQTVLEIDSSSPTSLQEGVERVASHLLGRIGAEQVGSVAAVAP